MNVEETIGFTERLCNEKGLRFTPIRRKVLTHILSNPLPSKAYDLLEKIGETNTSAKPPTVYRALDFLLEIGLVHRLNSLNAYVGCNHPNRHRQCYFLICRSCGQLTECCNAKIGEAIQATTDAHQFEPSHTTLEITGVCEHCQQ